MFTITTKINNMQNQILLDRLQRLELKQKITRSKETGYRVYYGWAKINKIRKKEAISVIFENEEGAGIHHRYGKLISKLQHTVFSRFQTEEEAEDASNHNKIYTEYSIYLNDKHINGSLEVALKQNYDDDRHNVSKEVRDEIANSLRTWFMKHHPGYKEKTRQLEIEFNDEKNNV